MRKVYLAASLVIALSMGVIPATGEPGSLEQPQEGLSGRFSLIKMVHTTTYQGQDLEENDPVPWEGDRKTGGPFRYASIPCSGNAPVNNISTDLTTYNTRIEGSRSPASTRDHPLEFKVVRNKKGKLRLRGTVTMTVCHLRGGPTPADDPIPDAEKPKIFFRWNARFKRTSAEEVRWHGKFRITGGTQRYRDLTGAGEIAGYFFCFAPEGCTTLGEFRDGQYTMAGTYHDPTPDEL